MNAPLAVWFHAGHHRRRVTDLRRSAVLPPMQIVPQNPLRHIEEHDKVLRRLLAERAPEWQSETGIRRIFARIKIEFWAWRQTARELRSRQDKDERYKIY